MRPAEFVAEVYRRMSMVHGGSGESSPEPTAFWEGKRALREYLDLNYRPLLPADLSVRVLDLGCGQGHFAVACREWGYANIAAADYGDHGPRLAALGVPAFLRVTRDISTLLRDREGVFDVIHAAHLIEHIPKHDLFETMDSLFLALRPGGLLFVETPNMLGPTALHSLFVTLGHEYGFTESNLASLLELSGFSSVRVVPIRSPSSKLRWRVANILRAAYLAPVRLRNRLFGWSSRHLTVSILGVGRRPERDQLEERRLRLPTPHREPDGTAH